MFAKDDSAITGAKSPIVRPLDCVCLDYEVELGLVIKKDVPSYGVFALNSIFEKLVK